VHPFTAAPPAARLLLVASAVVWLLVELRESTNRRPEATLSDQGSRMYIRVASIVGIVGAVILTRNVPSGRISPDLAWAGLVVFWCGMALRFWSFRALGRYFTFKVQTSLDQPVITSGPYRFVRHPSYAAVLLMVMGVGLFLGSWWSFAWLTASVFCGFLFRIRVEERALLLQLGERYVTYAADHKRLVPFIW
jgi:protein-S-isoprenylcysteine O-methyltransferase Ste14